MACRLAHQITLFILSLASATWPAILPPPPAAPPSSIYTGRYIIETQRVTLGDIVRQLQLEEERRNPTVDLRAYNIFRSNGEYHVECCPSSTQRNRRTFAVNKRGLVVELFQMENFTQAFYETTCIDESGEQAAANMSCKFVDPQWARQSRCVQQWSYVYAIVRIFGRHRDQFNLDYVRIPTGCKCQVSVGTVAAVRIEHYGSTTENPFAVA